MKILWVSKTLKRQEAELRELPENETILMVDLDRCISCGSCHFACEVEQKRGSHETVKPKAMSIVMKKTSGYESSVHLPLACRDCSSPCSYQDDANGWITCPEGPRDAVEECDFCAHRLKKGMMPACATRCSMKCIYFGLPKDVWFALNEKRLRGMGDLTLDSPAGNLK
jgi:Fe-S-cluster-containing dehydrogenase component